MRFFNFSRNEQTSLESPAKRKAAQAEAEKPEVTLSKGELLSDVANELGLSNVVVTKIFDECLDAIASALKDGRIVQITGFGKFRQRKPRVGGCRNPGTGKKVPPPNRKSVTFRPSSALKSAL